jgi:hypothetical protein
MAYQERFRGLGFGMGVIAGLVEYWRLDGGSWGAAGGYE